MVFKAGKRKKNTPYPPHYYLHDKLLIVSMYCLNQISSMIHGKRVIIVDKRNDMLVHGLANKFM